MNKKLSQMGSAPTGAEAFSTMKYLMDSWPETMVKMWLVYDKNPDAMRSWCTGFAYALCLVEECGVPVDLDNVLYSWADPI